MSNTQHNIEETDGYTEQVVSALLTIEETERTSPDSPSKIHRLIRVVLAITLTIVILLASFYEIYHVFISNRKLNQLDIETSYEQSITINSTSFDG